MTVGVTAKIPIKWHAASLPLQLRAMNHPGSLVTFFFPSCELSPLHGKADLVLGLASISADLQTLPGKNVQKHSSQP